MVDISSGIDSMSLINSLMAVERIPVQRMELKQDQLSKKSEIYGDVLTRLTNLEDYSLELSEETVFDVFSISYSEDSILTVEADSNAIPSSYSITVNNIARAHTIGSDQQADCETALGLGAGTISINGYEVSIDSEDSLSSIRDKINSTEDITVSANIVDNVLRLKNTETGATDIQIIDDNNICSDLGILDGVGGIKNEFIAGEDASFTIDGQEITSSSNEIEDLIDGLSISLIDSGSTEVTVSRDSSSIISNIENMVNQYNSVLDFIHSKISEERVFPAESEADQLKGLLFGDSTLNNIKYRLNRMATSIVNGMDSSFDQMADIGISKMSFDSESSDNSGALIGKLEIDEETLEDAIDNNFEEVKELFTKNYGEEDLDEDDYGIAVKINNYVSTLTDSIDGIIPEKQDSFGSEVDLIEERIESMERNLELKEETLREKFIAMEKALSTMDTQSMWLQAQVAQL